MKLSTTAALSTSLQEEAWFSWWCMSKNKTFTSLLFPQTYLLFCHTEGKLGSLGCLMSLVSQRKGQCCGSRWACLRKPWRLQSEVRGLWNPSKEASCQEPHRRMTEQEGVLQRGRAGLGEGEGMGEAGRGSTIKASAGMKPLHPT